MGSISHMAARQALTFDGFIAKCVERARLSQVKVWLKSLALPGKPERKQTSRKRQGGRTANDQKCSRRGAGQGRAAQPGYRKSKQIKKGRGG